MLRAHPVRSCLALAGDATAPVVGRSSAPGGRSSHRARVHNGRIGFSEEELVGASVDRVLIDDREGLDSIVSSVFTHREKTYRTRTGEHVAVRFSNALLRDDNGQLSGIVCVASDIRRDKELERNLREAKELAEDATKAKSHFLANMSHVRKVCGNAICAANPRHHVS